jgi:hypothetical protein
MRTTQTPSFLRLFSLTLRFYFADFEIGKDIWVGIKLGLGGLGIALLFDLSQKADLEEHPLGLVLSTIGPFLLWFVWEIGKRVVKALWRTSSQSRFKETAQGVLGIVVGAFVFFTITAHPIYQSYPHPHLTVPTNEWEMDKVPGWQSRHATSTYILFRDVVLTNDGADTTIGTWWIDVRTIGGVNFHGFMDYIDLKDEFGLPGFIFTKVARTPLRHGQTVHGAATFIITGAPPAVLGEPGTKFRIHFSYANGRVYTLELVNRSS